LDEPVSAPDPDPGADIVIRMAGVGVRRGRAHLLRSVDWTVELDERWVVLGPNGAGKTTTLEVAQGHLSPSAGTVRVLGTDPVGARRAWRARVGVVCQSTSLDDQLSVRELVELFAGVYPQPEPVPELLARLGLADDADVRVAALSGGQRRRVDLALGLVGRPDVLFLDEPTTGLDPEARRRTWAAIRALAESGTAVLLTTHALEEAAELADRIVVLVDGRVAADTTPAELRGHAATTIRLPLPAGAPVADLPVDLAGAVEPDGRRLVIGVTDLVSVLADLVGWARRNHLDLDALEIAPASLEEAYLAVTQDAATAASKDEVRVGG
jgi:ABC-2 type transport system ATP-binding protein